MSIGLTALLDDVAALAKVAAASIDDVARWTTSLSASVVRHCIIWCARYGRLASAVSDNTNAVKPAGVRGSAPSSHPCQRARKALMPAWPERHFHRKAPLFDRFVTFDVHTEQRRQRGTNYVRRPLWLGSLRSL
jgi:hypothetical protein